MADRRRPDGDRPPWTTNVDVHPDVHAHRRRRRRRGRLRRRRPLRLLRRLPGRARRRASQVHQHEITAFIGPSGCGKTTVLRCFNRMNDLIEIARVEGKRALPRRRPLRPRGQPGRGAPPDRHGVPEAEPVPEVDLRQRRLRAQLAGAKGNMDDIVERALRRRGAVGRGEGPAEGVGAWASRAASSSGCASPGPSPSTPR